MSFYELAVLYHCDFESEIDTAYQKVKRILTDLGGVIKREDNWGKRQLAYSIKNQPQAIYVFYDVDIEGSNLQKLEQELKILDEVLRWQIYKPDLKALSKAQAIAAKRKPSDDSAQEAEENDV